jgi:hypothetical protein
VAGDAGLHQGRRQDVVADEHGPGQGRARRHRGGRQCARPRGWAPLSLSGAGKSSCRRCGGRREQPHRRVCPRAQTATVERLGRHHERGRDCALLRAAATMGARGRTGLRHSTRQEPLPIGADLRLGAA